MTPHPSDCESWALRDSMSFQLKVETEFGEDLRLDGLGDRADLVDLSANQDVSICASRQAYDKP
jgi:hypothetical protein